ATLRRGDLELIATGHGGDHTDLFVYTRTLGDEQFLCALNLSDYRPTAELPDSLADRSWHEWRGGAFQPVPAGTLDGTLAVEPNEYQIWYSREDPSGP
ncbi:MAG: hypothetical protein GF330_07865, partial [Candidatus Eisenbacteria bacterium]|nr:hypothetical protein [Candidatus Eisenbacteria bacterium]